MLFDVFVSHASEDKDDIVRSLAERLRDAHIEVWYDEFSLSVGNSLRRSIDKGLAQSRWGVVVLSPAFFAKQWSQWELDGLVARQNSAEDDLILPVWHNVSRDDVLAFSPPLADRFAVLTSEGLEAVVEKLVKVIRPQGSSLIEAREFLIEKGWDNPPVISDDWWLDMAGAADSNSDGSAMGWGRWGFPLPRWENHARARGRRIGQAALQEMWKLEAQDRPITQVTPPEQVHDFMVTTTGLLDICLEYPKFAIEYAPQLVIPGFGGPLEDEIQRLYQIAAEFTGRRRPEQLALRAPDFWDMDPALVACHYVQGDIMGPSTTFYDTVDIAVWLLSEASQWLPTTARAFLTQGMIEWSVWPWHTGQWRYEEEFGFEPIDATGALADRLHHARSAATVRITRKIRADIEHRLDFTAGLLGLPESGGELANRFLEAGFIEGFYEERARRRVSG